MVQGQVAKMGETRSSSGYGLDYGVATVGRLNFILVKWAVMEVLSREITSSDIGLPHILMVKPFRLIYPGIHCSTF